ncbi:MAG: class I SAM-dependent methyltransferase [Gammaproteobacteria bacterium]|nr:class I SAM-dependent methyltransferase [Gammaproteobacteria bacterium]MDH3449932.1 class I SAM-dependent methyltransferase [Gammaproteobacteria bacterium]
MANRGHSEGITMSGGGLYSLATVGAKHVIDAATPLVVAAIGAMDAASIASRFTLSDMGTADAGTSLSMVASAIDAVRARVPEAAVTVVYSDQPRNDFNALIANVYGLGPFETYLDRHDNVFPLVSGTTFYKQIVPAATLDVGFSATAMHWMSTKVCNISNHVQAVGASGKELDEFRRQAHLDWRQILLNRARELKPGGKLVLINFGRDEQGRYLGNTGGINMFDTFNQIWINFLDQKRITRDEYENMTLPQYYNTVDEFSAPLVDTDDAVYRAGLRLDHIDTRIVKCPFAESFREHGDAARFAEEYIPTIRSWNESIFFNALAEARPFEERRDIIEDYYASYRDMVRESPEGHGMDYVHAYMVISKQTR